MFVLGDESGNINTAALHGEGGWYTVYDNGVSATMRGVGESVSRENMRYPGVGACK